MSEFSAALEAVNTTAAALATEYETLEPRVSALEQWALDVVSPRVIRVSPSSIATENVASLRAAIALLKDGAGAWAWGGTLLLRDGIWALDDTVEFRDMWGVRLIGDSRAVEVKWRGPADQPVFRFEHCRDFEVAQLRMLAEMPWYAAIQTRRDNTPPSVVPPRYGHVHDLYIDCNNGKGQNGIVIGGIGASNANNDFHTFERVQINAYTHAAFFGSGMQAYGLRMEHCEVWGNGIGQYAFACHGYGTGESPSIIWRGGSIFQNTVADFVLGRSYQTMIIEGVNVEGSKRFLDLPGNGGLRTIHLRDVRWSGGGLHADNRAIVAANNFKLLMEGCSFGDGPNPTRPLQFDFNTAGAYSFVEIRGCTIFSTASRLWAGAAPNIFLNVGNTQYTNESTLSSVPIAP